MVEPPPVQVTTQPAPFDSKQQEMFDAVVDRMDENRMEQFLVDLVDIHSPTGGEAAASRFVADHLTQKVGLTGGYQPISEYTGNVLAERSGSGGGARMLLYAPIDTHIDPELDVPWVAPELRDDMIPHARVEDGLVVGLGASNPKCMVAGIVELVNAVVDADVGLLGDLVVGFAGGGMPWSASRRDSWGMSSGVYHLLMHGGYPDMAAVLKPRWAVYPEEPGMCWFQVNVRGTFGYAGITRGTPGFRSSIVPAARVIEEIEAWLPTYAERNRAGFVNPEGWISAVRAGDRDKPTFPSATTEINLDVRVNPRTSPGEVYRQFGELIEQIRQRHPDVELDFEMYGSMPGGMTPADHWIIQSAQRGVEVETGIAYTETPYQAGQTDGTMLRVLGVPTARVGYPWPPDDAPAHMSEGLGGMGVASVPDVMKGVRTLAYSVIDTLSRSREDLNL